MDISTSQQARYGLAAASLSTQGLAFFAGGFEGPDLAYYEPSQSFLSVRRICNFHVY